MFNVYNNNYSITKLYDFYVCFTLKYTDMIVIDIELFKEILKNSFTYFKSIDNDIFSLAILSKKDNLSFIQIYFDNSYDLDFLKFIETHQKEINQKEIWIHCFSPYQLPFKIKDTYMHTNYQGVIENSKLHKFYIENKYKFNSVQETLFMMLSKKNKPTLSIELVSIHKEKNVCISYYNKNIHSGFNYFLKELKNSNWEKVLSETNKPILVATINNNVVGFAGPLSVANDKRGEFSGIGVINDAQGFGLGKLLFYNLHQELYKMGATYMSLYTGRTNKALKIYQDAGFEIVQSFVTLKKTL
ncbi:GNAT family N-acetyltransferase [Haploplasma axanthum]|uniref:Predicted acetyltransferase n=1 Tax=Haploplasma axanthum TaxID=29552 RepID=A0A449BCG0_HAPAX|nr:GNAT family N-acetyltransferase [Haploplasma axanthum]VEU80134.1 Predicted acetyltransferase [Haploplasma axanthum]